MIVESAVFRFCPELESHAELANKLHVKWNSKLALFLTLAVSTLVGLTWRPEPFPICSNQQTHVWKYRVRKKKKRESFYQWMTWWMIRSLQSNQTGSFEVNDKVQGWLRCGICFMETPSTCPHLAGQRGHAPFAPTRLSAASCLAELLPKFLDPLCRARPGN